MVTNRRLELGQSQPISQNGASYVFVRLEVHVNIIYRLSSSSSMVGMNGSFDDMS